MIFRIVLASLLLLGVLQAEPKYQKRLNAAASVFSEIMAAPDNSIPHDLLNMAECVVVVPGAKKGAFIFGGKYGRGYLSCRKKDGVGWTGPGGVRIEGFNFGLQIGGSETDLVLLIMNQTGMKRLMTSRFTIGGDASAAAGPVGRTVTANTDAFLSAEILSWSRSRGVFAGISLDGATLREDIGVNERVYNKRYTNKDIVEYDLDPPANANQLAELLNKYSGRKGR